MKLTGILFLLIAAGCARAPTKQPPAAVIKTAANEFRFPRALPQVQRAAEKALKDLLRESDPPTVLTLRGDHGQLVSAWYYGAGSDGVAWRRRTTLHFLSDGDDTLVAAYTERQRRLDEGWSPETESDDAYRRLNARIRDHLP